MDSVTVRYRHNGKFYLIEVLHHLAAGEDDPDAGDSFDILSISRKGRKLAPGDADYPRFSVKDWMAITHKAFWAEYEAARYIDRMSANLTRLRAERKLLDFPRRQRRVMPGAGFRA